MKKNIASILFMVALCVLFAIVTVMAESTDNYFSFNQIPTVGFNPLVVKTKTASYTALIGDDQINAAGGTTITLPDIRTLVSNGYATKTYKIVKNDTNSSSVTIQPGTTSGYSADTIAGQATRLITAPNGVIIISSRFISGLGSWRVEYETGPVTVDMVTGVGLWNTGIGVTSAIQTATTTTTTLTYANAGYTLLNTGMTATAVFVLPAPSSYLGRTLHFISTTAKPISLVTDSSATQILGISGSTVGKSIYSSGAAGESVVLTGITATQWISRPTASWAVGL
jgi:hypothetical protein